MGKSFWKSSASAFSNGDLTSIQTYSGYGLAVIDRDAPEYLYDPAGSDEELGKAILNALRASRMIDPNDDDFFDNTRADIAYKNWIEKIKSKYGYKTKTALFKKMMNCDIYLEHEIIIIEPSNHEKLEGWSGDGINEEDYVRIPANSPPEEIGAGLRLAFKRCLGPKPDEYC